MASRELSIVMAVKGAAQAISQIRAVDKATGNLGRTAGRGVRTAAGNLVKGATIIAGGTAALVGASVKAASDFETAFTGVEKTVAASDLELANLKKTILDLSTTIPISATELAALGEAAGALGVDVKNIDEFIRVTALIGETTDVSSEQAATSLGVLQNVLGLTAEEYERFGAALVGLGNDGASTESQILAITERFGAAGKLAGLTTTQILGLSSATASLGIEAEAGGTSLQKLALQGIEIVAQGGKKLELFARTAGMSAKQFERAWKEDAGGALTDFLTGLGKLDQGQQVLTLGKLGLSGERLTRTLLGLANGSEELNRQMGVSEKAWEDNIALQEEASKKFKTLSAQGQLLRNAFTRAGIAVGTGLLEPLSRVAGILTESLTDTKTIQKLERLGESLGASLESLVTKIGPNIPAIVERLADAFSEVAEFIADIDFDKLGKSIPWDAIGRSMELAGRGAKIVYELFTSLPSWVQTAVLTGWGLNKLTGGALGSILGQVVAKGVGAMMVKAGIVNVNGPVAGGGGKGGGLPVPTLSVAAGAAAGGGFLAAGPLAAAVAVAVPLVMLLAIPLLTKGKPGQGGPSPGGANARWDGEAFNQQFMKSLSPALAAAAYGPEARQSDNLTRARIDAVSDKVNEQTGFVTGELHATTAAINAQTGFVTGSLTQMDAAIVQSAASAERGRNAVKDATDRVRTGIDGVKLAYQTKTGEVVAATREAARVFQNKKLTANTTVRVNVTTKVTTRDIVQSAYAARQYGFTTPSGFGAV